MSVLYKALQKAEKENELRQSATESGFETRGLGASGASHFGGSSRAGANRVAMAVIVLVAVLGGGAFLLFKDSLMPGAPVQVAQVPPAPVINPPANQPSAVEDSATQPATDSSGVEQIATADAEGQSEGSAAQTGALDDASSPDSEDADLVEVEAQEQTQVASRSGPVEVAPMVRAIEARRAEPMPAIPVDSPARMLNPPIAINRPDYALAGVGDQVQVREVSQVARSNVSAGYEALIVGSYDAALAFYDKALTEEPTSVLALLGRGAALQKLGRAQEAQGSYDQVLKYDPENREALTNVTSIIGERAPQDALERLLELERRYAGFSPIKAQIGLAYAKLGSMPQAFDYFRRAVALSPETVMYRYNMALVLDHMGRRLEAVAAYRTVLDAIADGRGPTELSVGEIERRMLYLRSR